MRTYEQSCADCAAAGCRVSGASRPQFCMTDQMPQECMQSAMEKCSEPENGGLMCAAPEVECEGYGKWPRVQETMEFARKMGFHRIGIATCVGLLQETQTLAQILRSNGFEVCGIACKAGMVRKVDVGIDEKCNAVGCNMCNPILQAELLNDAGTELNIVMGLCVGHDSLFYKYSKAVTTTLVAKDRVTGNNPAAALYTAKFYYRRLFGKENEK